MADPHQSALDATYLVAELTKLDPDMSAIAAFAAKEADFNAKVAELEGVTRERDEVGGWHRHGKRVFVTPYS